MKLLAVQLNIKHPVILLIFLIGERIINEVVAREVICCKQLLDGEIVFAREFNNAHAGQVEFVHLLGKLAVLIVPKDDSAFMKLGQRRCEPLRKP